MGQYHTMDIELNQSIKLEKICWDIISLERLDEACDPAAKADLAAVVMQEGLANVCLITSSMTVSRAKIERRMPRKGQVHFLHQSSGHFLDS
jgi:protein pelota